MFAILRDLWGSYGPHALFFTNEYEMHWIPLLTEAEMPMIEQMVRENCHVWGSEGRIDRSAELSRHRRERGKNTAVIDVQFRTN